MNKDIEIMIELQRYWDSVLRAKTGIEKGKDSIKKWNKDVEDKRQSYETQSSEIKEIKLNINQFEVELKEKDGKAEKLEDRRKVIKTEKELQALESELQKLNDGRGELEEKLIELFDTLEEKESKSKETESEFAELEKQSGIEINKTEDDINRLNELEAESKSKFDAGVGDLSPDVKPRFQKYIQGYNGKAIASINEDETCSACNFKIPTHILQEVSKSDSIVNCLNCNRFLYKK